MRIAASPAAPPRRAPRHGYATHTAERIPEYLVWVQMRQRCQNPRNKDWPRYGARGITVCDRWRSFPAFLADMGFRPSDRHSIDRINVDGPYAPANCRWATPHEQARNRRPRPTHPTAKGAH